MSLLLGPLGVSVDAVALPFDANRNAVPPVVVAERGTDYESALSTLAVAYTLDLEAGAYVYVGLDATLTYQAGAGSGINYTLDCSAGAYVYTGQSATLVVGRKLALSAGAYTYTGQSATLVVDRKLALSAGAYTYTGQAADLLVSRNLALSAGAYTYTGQDALLTYDPGPVNYTLDCSTGEYVYSGGGATLTHGQRAIGLFRPLQAAVTPTVSSRCTATWALLNPDPVVKIVIPAETQFVPSVRLKVRWYMDEPYFGLTTPAIIRKSLTHGEVVSPAAAGVSPFVLGRGYSGGDTELPECGCGTPGVPGTIQGGGFVNYPTAIQNPTREQLVALL